MEREPVMPGTAGGDLNPLSSYTMPAIAAVSPVFLF